LPQLHLINPSDTRDWSGNAVERRCELADHLMTVSPYAANDTVHLFSTWHTREHFMAPAVDSATVVRSPKVELPLSIEDRNWRPQSLTDWRGASTGA
jgi:hypothetical protein